MTARRVVLFYKPFGVVSQFSPLSGHPTLADFGLPAGVYPCGRLDHDSEGLLVLSDDGAFQHRLSDPRFAHPRTYLAQVERVPSDEALEHLRRGPRLSDGPTRPCAVARLDKEPDLPAREPPIRFRKNVATAWIALTLSEGRNRQVRRMTAAVGHPTLRLVRTEMASYSLAGLKPGAWRLIRKNEPWSGSRRPRPGPGRSPR